MASPYMPNLGSHPQGLGEAPVVHRPGPGQLGEVSPRAEHHGGMAQGT